MSTKAYRKYRKNYDKVRADPTDLKAGIKMLYWASKAYEQGHPEVSWAWFQRLQVDFLQVVVAWRAKQEGAL
ncbi:hypothetical protein CC53_gp080 [Rhizobium phage vB_RleS_L338C]|uniref:hypothetical protein n=1 Tax=Rhizobium phage vB_RleS_L338C TaxID=1414737 RepID=UPI0003D7F4A8|nr:hypothetical protein CC53_gp080 [Rhizobium phage vB_RleS_L338C]AHC30497.1 hypothetical protein L338C_080 [Rhizobium phage vB_RleS_L338C]QNH72171.1 hypothetical protein P11VFA_069 [Rhizobium phage P11VFA]